MWCLFLFPAYLSPSNKLTALPVFVLYFFKLDSFLSIIFRKGHLLVTFWIVFKLRKSILYCIKAKKKPNNYKTKKFKHKIADVFKKQNLKNFALIYCLMSVGLPLKQPPNADNVFLLQWSRRHHQRNHFN